MDVTKFSRHKIFQKQINHLNYSYLHKGSGPTILLLHGFPDLANTWDDTIDALSDTYNCIAPFLTGYYPTEVAKNGDYSPKRIAIDMADLLTELDIQEFIVVGHDWGASIAYSLANLCPERIRKLVTIAIPHPQFIRPSLKLLYKARHFLALRNEKSSRFAKKNNFAYIDTLYQRWAPNWSKYQTSSRQIKQVLALPGHFEAIFGYYWSFAKNQKNKELNHFLQRLPQMPVLVFMG
ncbi:MAG: alpha/beta hydrolase, partial [Spirochaetota bacterium]